MAGSRHGVGILGPMMCAGLDHEPQLQALRGLHDLFELQGIDYWVFGGWAVDLHAGRLTRPHADIDVAVFLSDLGRIDESLSRAGWRHAPQAGEDGYTQYVHEAARLDLAFLVRDDDGVPYTPTESGRGDWPQGSFGNDVADLLGVRARVVSLPSLLSDKSEVRSDPSTRAKDQADVAVLVRVAKRRRPV
jgi:hypothetical protein